uniref:PHD-type domain-containing protein n=1 Tax=Panagrellus redivivus TaxID=6233 RepID=A0A7E4VX54_PANRE
MHELNGSGQCLLQQASSFQPNLRSQKVTDEQVILSQDTAGTSRQCDKALGSTTTDPAIAQPVQPVFSSSTNPAPLVSSNPDSQPQSQFPTDVTNRHNSTEDEAAARAFQMRLQAKPNAYNTIIHGADIPKRSSSRKPNTGQRKAIPTSSDAATKSSPRKPKPRLSPRGTAPKRQRSGTVTAKNSTPSTSKSPSRPPATKLKKQNTNKDVRNPLYISIDPENGTTVPVQQKAKKILHRKVAGHVNAVLSKAICGVDVIDVTASPSISNTDTTSLDNSSISVSEQCGFSEATTSSPISNLSTTLTEDDKGADKEPAAESAVSSVQSAEEPMQYEDNDTLTYENPVANALSVLTPSGSSRRVPEQQEQGPSQTTEAAVAQPSVKGSSGVETIKQLMAIVNFADDWRLQVVDKDAYTEKCPDGSFSHIAGVSDWPVDVEPDLPGLYKPETDDEDEDDLDDSKAPTRVNSRASVEMVEPEVPDDSSVEILSAKKESLSDEEVWTSNESSSDEESDSTPYCSDREYSPVSYLSDCDSPVQYLSDSDEESETPADAADKESETAADVAEEEGETAADVADGETASVICLSDEEEESSDEEVTRATCRNYIKRWMPNPFETKWYKQAKFIPRQPPKTGRVVIGNPGELPTFRPIEDVPVPSPPKQNIVKPWKDALPPYYLKMAKKYETAVNDAHVRLRERTEDFHWKEYTNASLRKYDVFWKHLVIRRRPMKYVSDHATRRQIISKYREEHRIRRRAEYVMNYFKKLREVRIERILTFLRKQKKLYLNEKLKESREKYKKTFWRRYLHRRMWRLEPVARFKAFMMTIAPANVLEEDWDEKQCCLSPTKKKKAAANGEIDPEAPQTSNPTKKKGSAGGKKVRKSGTKKSTASRNLTVEPCPQSTAAPSTATESVSTVPSTSDAPAPKRARQSQQPAPEDLILHRVIPGPSSQFANKTLPTESNNASVPESASSDAAEKRYPARSRIMKKLTYPSEDDAQAARVPTPVKPPTPIAVTPPPLEDISTDNILPTSKRSVARVTRAMIRNSATNTPSKDPGLTNGDASDSVNATPGCLTTTPVKSVPEGEENVAVSTATRAVLQNPTSGNITSVESEPQCKETVVEPPKTLYPCLKSVVAVKPRLPPQLPQVKAVQKAAAIQPTGQPKPAATVSADKPRDQSQSVKVNKSSVAPRTTLSNKPATTPAQAPITTTNPTPAVNGVSNEASGQETAPVPEQSPMKTVRPMPIVKDKVASKTPSTKLPGQKPAVKKLKRKIKPPSAVNGEPSASTTQLPQNNGSPTSAQHATVVPTAVPMPTSNAIPIVPDEPNGIVPLPTTETTATVQVEIPTAADQPPTLMVTGIPTLLTLPPGCTMSSEEYMMKLFDDLLTEFTQDGVQKSPDLVTKHLESVMVTFGNEVTSLHYVKLRHSITTDWMKIKYPLDFCVTQEDIEAGIVLSVDEAQNAVNYICSLNGANLPTAHTKYQELRDKYKTDWKRVTFPPPEYFDRSLPGSSTGFAGYVSIRSQHSTPVKNGQNGLSASNSSNNSPLTEAYKRNLRVIVPTPPKKQRVEAAPAEAQKAYNRAIADLRNAVFNEKK